MANDPRSRRTDVLGNTIRRLLRRGARNKISRLLGRERPEDVAVALRRLTPAEQLSVFRLLLEDHLEGAGELLTKLEPEDRRALLAQTSPEDIARLLKEAPVDDAVFIIDSLPEELKQRVLEIVDLDEHLNAVQEQLTYGDDSAGRIMDTEFLALEETMTVQEAIERVRAMADQVDMISYLYVVDAAGHLLGVTSLRQLLLAEPGATLGTVMTTSLIKVRTDTDQEEVAQLAARYDLLAIPVTDEDNKLVGIVTVDDIIDIMKDEATEDFFKAVGTTGDELTYQEHAFRVAGIRLPWLLVNLVGLLIAGYVTRHYQETFRLSLLIGFIPVIMGTAGNIGSQTSTIAVRSLATGRFEPGGIAQFVWRQIKVGIIIGAAVASLVTVVTLLLDGNLKAAAMVAPSVMIAIVVASFVGATAPALFSRLGIDPAVASGPLVTTATDVLGISIYFGLTALFTRYLPL
ncbi:MAG: magnesium transporter [Acidobacteria bacterium]|nr:MAG: magnesium transporter [Acidobacteriota bacterium]